MRLTASLCLPVFLLLAPAARLNAEEGETPASDARDNKARSAHDRGQQALDAGDAGAAYESFAAAYAIDKSARSHLMMARALLALGQIALACNDASAVAAEAGGSDPGTAEAADALVAELLPSVALLTLRLQNETGGSARLMIGQTEIPNGLTFALEPGTHYVDVMVTPPGSRAEHVAHRVKVALTAGDARTFELSSKPPVSVASPSEEPSSPRRMFSGGLTLGGAVLTALGSLEAVGTVSLFFFDALSGGGGVWSFYVGVPLVLDSIACLVGGITMIRIGTKDAPAAIPAMTVAPGLARLEWRF